MSQRAERGGFARRIRKKDSQEGFARRILGERAAQNESAKPVWRRSRNRYGDWSGEWLAHNHKASVSRLLGSDDGFPAAHRRADDVVGAKWQSPHVRHQPPQRIVQSARRCHAYKQNVIIRVSRLSNAI